MFFLFSPPPPPLLAITFSSLFIFHRPVLILSELSYASITSFSLLEIPCLVFLCFVEVLPVAGTAAAGTDYQKAGHVVG